MSHASISPSFNYSIGDLSITSIDINTSNDTCICRSRRSILPFEIRKATCVSLAESARRTKNIHLTIMSQVCSASCVGRRAGWSEQLTINGTFSNFINILEHIAFSNNVSTLADLKRVSAVIVSLITKVSTAIKIEETGQCFRKHIFMKFGSSEMQKPRNRAPYVVVDSISCRFHVIYAGRETETSSRTELGSCVKYSTCQRLLMLR